MSADLFEEGPPAVSEAVRSELTRLLAELDAKGQAPSPVPAPPQAPDTSALADEASPRVTVGDIALALGRPAHTSFAAIGVMASVLFLGAWFVSAWGSVIPAPPQALVVHAESSAGASSDPGRMTQVQAASDVVHLWAHGGVGNARVIRGQMWWSPSTGVAVWARADPLAGDSGLGYQAWFVSDRGPHYLGPVTVDQAGTISVSFDPPRQPTGRPVRVLVTLQPPGRMDHPADRIVLEARF
jgi:hypothetical protein